MQSSPPLLSRSRARDDVRALLRTMILDGELAASQRLEEVELSRRLGVSRTPFREALIALEEEGLVRSIPNRGFAVAPADEDLVREVFPLLGMFEATAVRLAGRRMLGALDELRDFNRRLARETRRPQQYDTDAAFHRRLVSDCGNPRLIRLWEQHWAHAQRFNGAHERGTADRDGSVAQHAEIIAAIEARRFEEAADIVWRHWTRGEEVVVQWLRDQA